MIIANQQILFTIADSARLAEAKDALYNMDYIHLTQVCNYFKMEFISKSITEIIKQIHDELTLRMINENEDPYDLLMHALYS